MTPAATSATIAAAATTTLRRRRRGGGDSARTPSLTRGGLNSVAYGPLPYLPGCWGGKFWGGPAHVGGWDRSGLFSPGHDGAIGRRGVRRTASVDSSSARAAAWARSCAL